MGGVMRWPFLLMIVLLLAGCTGKPLVHGLLDSDGMVYREAEQEEWGARTTVKVRPFEF